MKNALIGSLLLVACFASTANAGLCDDIGQIMGAAKEKFIPLRGAFDEKFSGVNYYTAKVMLPIGNCNVDDDKEGPQYRCRSKAGQNMGDYESFVNQMKSCNFKTRPGTPRANSRTSKRGFTTNETMWEVLIGGTLVKTTVRHFDGDGGRLYFVAEMME